MTAIADASDIPVWGWQVWGVVGLAFIVAVAVVLYLDATHPFPTPRDAARTADSPSTPPSGRACSVHTCALPGRWSIKGWPLCAHHAEPILSRSER
jgi:hypothetical protein